MAKIAGPTNWGPLLERQIERLSHEFIAEYRRAYAIVHGRPRRWEEHLECWLRFNMTYTALEISFSEWECLRRRDQRPEGLIHNCFYP